MTRVFPFATSAQSYISLMSFCRWSPGRERKLHIIHTVIGSVLVCNLLHSHTGLGLALKHRAKPSRIKPSSIRLGLISIACTSVAVACYLNCELVWNQRNSLALKGKGYMWSMKTTMAHVALEWWWFVIRLWCLEIECAPMKSNDQCLSACEILIVIQCSFCGMRITEAVWQVVGKVLRWCSLLLEPICPPRLR